MLPVRAVTLDPATSAVFVSWDRNPEPDVAFYLVRYGKFSGSRDQTVESDGPAISAELTHLGPGIWYCAVQAVNISGLAGKFSDEVSFVIPKYAGPVLSVRSSTGPATTSGSSLIDMGSVTLGASSSSELITIANVGDKPMIGLTLRVSGDDFSADPLGTSTLAAGAITTFTVHFNPLAVGDRSGSIIISSISLIVTSFELKLDGIATAARRREFPDLKVIRASSALLAYAAASVIFSASSVGPSALAETFTLRNTGIAPLPGVTLKVIGTPSSATVLQSGEVASSQLYLQPTSNDTQVASLQIANNDSDNNTYDVAPVGTGITAPEIAVSRSGIDRVDGAAGFGGVQIGNFSPIQVFTIANPGTADLTGIGVTVDGPDAKDFDIFSPASTTLSPGTSNTFQVTFHPSATGSRTAVLHVASNDATENPFEIPLSGTGIEPPPALHPGLLVTQNAAPADTSLTVNFDETLLDRTSTEKIFTITNTGPADLTGLEISTTGAAAEDFIVKPSVATSLAPGQSSTFKVNFKPAAAGSRVASLLVSGDDAVAGIFKTQLEGTGVARPHIETLSGGLTHKDEAAFVNLGSSALGSASRSKILTNGVEVVGGLKYRSLTITFPAGVSPGDIEVSGNLLDWFSGNANTCIMIDTANILKVRDKVPVSVDNKRYIRVRRVRRVASM